jgi:hypothetical protein
VLLEAYVPLRRTAGRYLTSVYTYDDTDNTDNTDDTDDTDDTDAPRSPETRIDHQLFAALLQKLAQQEDYLAGRLHTSTLSKRKQMLQQQRYPKEGGGGGGSRIISAAAAATARPQNGAHPSHPPPPPPPPHHRSHQSHSQPRQPPPHLLQQHTLAHELKHLQTLPPALWASDDAVLPGTAGWKRRYYREIERVGNMRDVHDMCRKYVEGIYWTLQYYMHGCWSTTWHYPYLSAPLFSNVAFVLDQPRVNINRLVRRHTQWDYSPTAQLLTIMPKESLLKYVYAAAATDAACAAAADAKGVADPAAARLAVHPVAYRLVPFSKRFRWECPVRLPRVDDAEVMRVQQAVACGGGRGVGSSSSSSSL